MHADERQVEQGLGNVITITHRIERVLEGPGEAQFGRGELGIERKRTSGQRTGPEGRDIEAIDGGEQTIDVSGQRPPVSKQVMSEQHRLRALEVCVAG